ncbi:RHS repeat-associated core domain-containing protein [Streptomyces sp. NPDC059070]|uniref:RHS repeat-associated core domain-containing protein n=1 Tax=Streptomyces sp. NPDC059070 TaxID=3346713 RepID=UPI0036864A74
MGTLRYDDDAGGVRRRATTALGALTASAVLVTLLPSVAAAAGRVDFSVRSVQKTASVTGSELGKESAAGQSETARRPWRAPKVSWPKAGDSEVDLSGVAADALAKSAAGRSVAGSRHAAAPGSPVGVAPVAPTAAKGRSAAPLAGAGGSAPAKVRVRMADRAAADRLGLDGVVLGVARDDRGAASGRASVRLDYTAFRGAYGADWGSRLRLVQLPACALSTPEKAECRTMTPLASRNDTKAGALTAEVALAPDTAAAPGKQGAAAAGERGTAESAKQGTAAAGKQAAAAPSKQAAAAGAQSAAAPFTVLAATATPDGANGDFKATSLSPSGSWTVGGNEGGFSWSYPLAVPPVPGDLSPKLGLGYSSSSVDGRTASTNNQPSALGEGWSMEMGFIERQYMACKDDSGTGTNAPAKSGDLCWRSDNAVMSLNGASTALVRTGTGDTWRPADDDGSRIERVKGTATDTNNGDDDNEYWKVTTLDGTQYWFGKNRLPGWATGKTETASAYTVPVYGNHTGEPGHATAFTDSVRNQAWRWNLDYVVDPHGNAMALFYTQEKNAYAKNSGGSTTTKPKADASYARAGYLDHIEYGHRAGQVYAAQPAAKVNFAMADRCLGTTTDCAFDKAHASNWPDTPVDEVCAVGADCLNGSPSFWSKKRLTSVTTQVLKGTGYADIDTWTFGQSFPGTGDTGGNGLWLDSITHTGKAGGTPLSNPAVTFGGTLMPNRVDSSEGRPPLNKYRITKVGSEYGGDTLVEYSPTECTYASPPDEATNTKRCFPTWWTPEGGSQPVKDWFHKYVVNKVTEDDKVAGTDSEVTEYEYLGGIAWAKDTSEFTLDKHRTYSDYRGYGKVRTRTGTTNRTLSETTYLRGLDGAQVADSFGALYTDAEQYSGKELESVSYDKDGGRIVESSVEKPWSKQTATQARPGTTDLHAYQTDTDVTTGRSLMDDGSWRTTRSTDTFDAYGQTLTTSDEGDLAVSGDEQCTRTTYVTPDTTAYLVSYIADEQKSSTTCATAATAATVTGETRTTYDTSAYGAAPVAGKALPSRIEELDHYTAGLPVFVATSTALYDAYGRMTQTVDAAGAKTLTAYTPATGAQPTTVKTTDNKGFVTSVDLDGLRGLTLKATDANGRVTSQEYDALGQLTAAWKPGRVKPASADVTFSYQVRDDGPTAVTSNTLLESGKYRKAVTLYDGLLRKRQVQTDAYGGTGRLITDSFYDSQGRVYKDNAEYYNDQPTAPVLFSVADNQVPAQTVTEFDGMGRTTAAIALTKGTERWRTTTSYGGDWTATVPPSGATATLVISNAHDKAVELRQYKDGNPVIGASADKYEALKYSYDTSDRLTRLVDAAGNTWSSTFDLRGRQITSSDPDKGAVTTTYTPDGKTETTKDARGTTLAYTYDEIGRPTSLRKDGVTGPKLAEWAYDSLTGGKKMLSSSTRWDNGNAYTTAVKGYDASGRATGSVITVPAAEGKLQGTYEFGSTYTPTTGLANTTTFPAGGGLPAETVRQGYTDYGLATTVGNGTDVYSLGNQYSPSGDILQTVLGSVGARTVQTYTYEEDTHRLSTVVNDRESSGPQTIDSKSYGYDPAGNITRIRDDRDDKASTDTQCFTYDFAARLSHAWTGTDDCALTPSTGVRPKVGGPDPYWFSYGYDTVGNRASEVRHDVSGDTSKDVRRGYSYPQPGETRPHGMDTVDVTGPGARTDSFEYDASGNTTRRVTASGDQKLTWDAEGNLASSTIGGQTSTFLYDADGSRLLRRDPGAVTLYLGAEELTLKTAGNSVSGVRYYSAGNTTVARGSDGSVTYLLSDAQGTDEVAVDSVTLAVTRRASGPFGTPRGTQPQTGWPGDHGFVGGVTDKSTGLTHLGAREYDAENGRFASVDPVMDLSDPQQINGYAYANNSPVTDSDPSGQFHIGHVVKAIKHAVKKVVHAVKRIVRRIVHKVAHTVRSSYARAVRAMWSHGEKGAQFGHFNVGKGPDRGIIMMRFFIHTKDAMKIPGLGYQLLGDDREYSNDPDAAYRMVLFWDTATGDVTFKVSPSHTKPSVKHVSSYLLQQAGQSGDGYDIESPSRMIPAFPLSLNDYPSESVTGRNIVNYSFLGQYHSNSSKLDLGIAGVNSLMSLFSVDTHVTIAANKGSVTVTRKGDHYPDMEVVQYRRAQPPVVVAHDRMDNVSGLDSMPWYGNKDMRYWNSAQCLKDPPK